MSPSLLDEGRTCPCVASDNSCYWKAVFNLKWPFLVFTVKLALQPTLNGSFCARAEKRIAAWGMALILFAQGGLFCRQLGREPGHWAQYSLRLVVKYSAKARLCVLICTLRKDGEASLQKKCSSLKRASCSDNEHSGHLTLQNVDGEFSG